MTRFLYGETLGCHPGARAKSGHAGLALLICASVVSAAPQSGGADYLKRHYDFGVPPASAVAASGGPKWVPVPRADGRITRQQLGLVINTADPYSVEVGEFYIKARGLNPAQVLRVQLPVRPALTPEEFKAFAALVDGFFGAPVQALALAWTYPYAVACNSITGALALGYDGALCAKTCAASARSPYFNNPSTEPWSGLKLRPSMLLAARDVAMAKAMIRRGVASDG
ncbi:MAG: TIGR03790 family protein, partial [Pseudomonadota bacterium]